MIELLRELHKFQERHGLFNLSHRDRSRSFVYDLLIHGTWVGFTYDLEDFEKNTKSVIRELEELGLTVHIKKTSRMEHDYRKRWDIEQKQLVVSL